MPMHLDMEYPFTGRWLVQNSPANRVPSHGTNAFASAYAIDFVPVDDDGRTAPISLSSLLRPESPERFPGFGRPLLAPVAGTIVAVHEAQADHPAYRGLPSVGYALSQRQRASAGWTALAGNHLFIQSEDVVVVLCHLRQGSVAVRRGQRINVGELLGQRGNSGNSTEPHVHVQALDTSDVRHAQPVALAFRGCLPGNGEIVEAGRGTLNHT